MQTVNYKLSKLFKEFPSGYIVKENPLTGRKFYRHRFSLVFYRRVFGDTLSSSFSSCRSAWRFFNSYYLTIRECHFVDRELGKVYSVEIDVKPNLLFTQEDLDRNED